MKLADQSEDENFKISFRTDYAAALEACGDGAAARVLFAEADNRMAKHYPNAPRLALLANVRLCDLLLSEGRFAEVKKRGAYGLTISQREEWVLMVGLDRLSLARAELGMAFNATTPAKAAWCVRQGLRHLARLIPPTDAHC